MYTNIVLYVHWDRFGKGHQTALRSYCTAFALGCAFTVPPPHTAPYVRMVCDMAYSAADSVCTVQAAVVIAKPGY
jgi:hypothetical protein